MARKRLQAAVWLGGLVVFTGGIWLFRKGRGKGADWWLRIPTMAGSVFKEWWLRSVLRDYHMAQHGEDRILADLFPQRDGFCVEVGANDGVEASNTFYFEKIGWEGILVEADPALAELCRQRRPRFVTEEAAAVAPGGPPTVTFQIVQGNDKVSSVSFSDTQRQQIEKWMGDFQTQPVTVSARTLDDILTGHAAPTLDFITIDVEGYEWDVLQGFDIERWNPKVVILERNSDQPDANITAYMERHKYRFWRTTPEWAGALCNDWYVADSFKVADAKTL
jgi:FkbM family methyltransferase